MHLRGFSTLSFWADDVAAAMAWYTEFLGFEVLASTQPA
jgi:catechol 2,3-dioxygenase-like lactoylglutathione lyase family enzyme